MLTFLTTAEHDYTIANYRELWGASLKQGVRCLPYELLFCMGSVPRGTYIFADLDRLSSEDLVRAGRWYQIMRDQGAAVLNDPRRFVGRYALLQKLYRDGRNDFRAYRLEERHLARFPVFLRFESSHTGPLSELLCDAESLEKQIDRFAKTGSKRELIVVEYLDYKEEDGRYYKYAHFRIGPRLIYAGMVCGASWCLKGVEDITDDIVKREQNHSLNHAHDESLMDCFEAAGVEFGRIDYAIVGGQLQVFEVNTNPDLGVACLPGLQRWVNRSRYYQEFNEALWEYHQTSSVRGHIATPGIIRPASLLLVLALAIRRPVRRWFQQRGLKRRLQLDSAVTTLFRSWISRPRTRD